MSTIDEIFRAAINPMLAHGDQTKLAKMTGIGSKMVNHIVGGERKGSEDDRRALAAALGYGGAAYEAFLDIGRQALGQPTTAKPATAPPSPEVARCLEQARHILEGPKGAALRVVLDDMSK